MNVNQDQVFESTASLLTFAYQLPGNGGSTERTSHVKPFTSDFSICNCGMLWSHPPLFDQSRLDFTTRSFRYSDKLTERNYLMT